MLRRARGTRVFGSGTTEPNTFLGEDLKRIRTEGDFSVSSFAEPVGVR